MNGTDAEDISEPGTVTIFPYRPRGFVEFDVTNAVKRWREGVPNNGLVIRATNELVEGRDIRFASNAMPDSSQHAYILVSVASSSNNESSSSQTSVVESSESSTRETPVKSSSALLPPFEHGVTQYDTGAGIVFKLEVVQDVTLERSTRNFNYLQYLIVSKHPSYPNKRSLVQFENLPSDIPSSKIKSAKMYLYYVYAHKASWYTITQVPFIPRYMQLHLVKKSWNEAQATSSRRDSSNVWTTPYLGLDGTDAEDVPEPGTVTIFPYRPRGFVEFDVTNAVKRWREGVPNNGLVISATNELVEGRDIRFASNAMPDSSQHPYILVSVASSPNEESSWRQTSVIGSRESSAIETPVKSSSGYIPLSYYYFIFPTITIYKIVFIF